MGNAFLSEYIPDVSPSFDSRLNFCWEILERKVWDEVFNLLTRKSDWHPISP